VKEHKKGIKMLY